ncbi:MAG: glycosyltransferase family 1 protein, partial [Tepidiformaceae bacterium]
ALAARDDCDVTFATPELSPAGAHQLLPPTRVGEEGRQKSAARLQCWTEFELPRWMKRHHIDLYHGVHFTVPLLSRMPRVATIHDLAPLTAPKLFQGRLRKLYWRWLVETSRHATKIVVPSTPVADDVMRLLGVPARRIAITPLAPRAIMKPAPDEAVTEMALRLGIDRPYLLCVGIWNRNKRAVDAFRALALLQERGIDLQLVLCGEPMPELAPHYQREVQKLGIADRVLFAGHVPDADLPALYTGAIALLFPSETEGFGLPPLEAMACGTPAIVASTPAVVEASGGGAIVVSRRAPGEIAVRAAELASNPAVRAERAARGTDHASTFTWARTAAATMEAYHSIT